MAVVNLTPADGIRIFPPGTVAGQMHVYNRGTTSPAAYVLQIGDGGPTEHSILVGHTDTYGINGQQFIIRNYGPAPSTLQILYQEREIDLDSVSKTVTDKSVQKDFDKKAVRVKG